VPSLVKLRSRDSLELTICYGLVLSVIWTPNPAQRILFWIALAWILTTTLIDRADANTLGLRPSGLRCSLWITAWALLFASLFVVIALDLHTLHRLHHGAGSLASHVLGYLLWALEQQFILQDYFLLRLLRILPNQSTAVIAAAVLFSTAHLPGPLLTAASLSWGIVSSILFLRCRNLYALGLVHGILGLCVAISVPDAVTHHMMVGLGYLRYHPH
jgi:hypothetical protein